MSVRLVVTNAIEGAHAGIYRITPRFTINNVIAITTSNSVIAGAAIQRIRTIAAHQAIIAAIAPKTFSAIAADQHVIARTAIDILNI